MPNQAYDQPTKAGAVDGDVTLDGPDGVGLSMTPRAARVTARRLAGAADKAQAQAKRKSKMPRELIDTGNDKRFVRRDENGRFKEVTDVGKSLAADRRTKAKTVAKKGEGDRGDQKTKKK